MPSPPCVNTIKHIACVVSKFVELALPEIACVAVKPSMRACVVRKFIELALPEVACVAVNTIEHIACVVSKFVELALPEVACVAVTPLMRACVMCKLIRPCLRPEHVELALPAACPC